MYLHNCNEIGVNKCFDEPITKFDSDFILFSVELINDNVLSVKDVFATRFYTNKPNQYALCKPQKYMEED